MILLMYLIEFLEGIACYILRLSTTLRHKGGDTIQPEDLYVAYFSETSVAHRLLHALEICHIHLSDQLIEVTLTESQLKLCRAY